MSNELVRLAPNAECWPNPNRTSGLVFRFANGYGASIIRGFGAYGTELAVLRFTGPGKTEWEITYDTPITDDVIGWLSAEECREILVRIAELPPKN